MQMINSKTKGTQTEVSIRVGDVAQLSLSGQYKKIGQRICDQWNAIGCQATITSNEFGNKKGFVVTSIQGLLVGFLNFYKPNVNLDEAVDVMNTCREFAIVNPDDLLSGI